MALDVIYPKHCPELRAEMLAYLRRDGMAGARNMLAYIQSDEDTEYMEMRGGPDPDSLAMAAANARRVAASVEIAELFIIAKHKVKDVLEAGEELPPELEVQRHWFHADHGIMFFEKPYMTRAFSSDDDKNRETPVAAISWAITGGLMRICAWTDSLRFFSLSALVSADDRRGRPPLPMSQLRQVAARTGPTVIASMHTLKLHDFMHQIAEGEAKDWARHPLRVLLSGLLMLKQSVTSRSVVEAPRSSWRRINSINPQLGKSVTVIDKRDVRKNPTNEDMESPSSRVLSVRYDRRGHWREYKSERFSPELREHPIWIPAHWVGHEGLPLATRSKVTRLTR